MKKTFLIIAAACLVVACGNNTGGGSSPEDAVKGAVKCLHEKDYNGYVQYLPLATVLEGTGHSERITQMTYLLGRIEGDYEDSFEDEVIEFIHDGRDAMIQRDNERSTQFQRQADPSKGDYQVKTVRARVRLRNGKEVNRAWTAIYVEGAWHVTPDRSPEFNM